ncbi:unnamed protein product [Anisakis simplex]|uniref:START domain-containing protein n=1 Tax=Anisakis simplex TaxID=6269 RepID=A0A0M3K706_ANISI|nr:unnamed protein product [Anisakis simplex]
MIEDWKRRFRESHPNTPIRGTEVFDYIQEWKQKRKQKRESRQKQNSIESNSDSDSSTSNTSGGDDQRQHTQTFCSAERQGFFDKKDKWKTDFVFMRIVPVEDDLSEQRVYSVGSPRFGLITSKMSKDSSRELLTRWVEHKASMRPKYMNKLPVHSLCRPVIYHDEAIFVDRANPKVAFGISIFEHPDEGLLGAIRDKLLAILFRDTYSEFKREIPIDCSRGCPPFKPANWSGACVIEDGYFVCVQDCYTRQGSVWKLKLNTSENRLLSVEWIEWLPELDLGQYDLVENGAFRMDKASRTACVSCHLITKGDYGDDIIHKICLSTLHPTKPKYSSEPKGRAQRVNVSGAPSS